MPFFRPAIALTFVLAGCVSVAQPDQTFAFKAGTGTVESVREARVAVPSGAIAGSASAGGSYNTPVDRLAQPRWVQGHQITLRMDDGTVQAVTQNSPAFKSGDRVQVTQDGRVVRVE